MGLALLILGLLVFIGGHALAAQQERRAALIARFGEGGYKLAFSLVSLAGLVLIGYGYAFYRTSGWVDVWYPPAWTRHVAVLLVWPAVILFVAAYLPGHIKRATKHPMLAGTKLWALAHLIANGDLGSMLLFGSILAWGVYARIMAKRREAAGAVAAVPDVVGWRNDAVAVGVGTLAYLALGFVFHPIVIGVPAFTR